MTRDLLVHPDALRRQVRGKYREVAIDRVRFIRRRRPGRPGGYVVGVDMTPEMLAKPLLRVATTAIRSCTATATSGWRN